MSGRINFLTMKVLKNAITKSNLIGMFDYSVKYVNNPSRPSWEPKVEQTMLDIYGRNVTVEEGI